MRNMMLQVKNYKHIVMKKSFIFALCSLSMVLLVLFSGCKNKEQDPETFVSDKTRPVWTAPEKSDITSSMTAVVKVDLKAQYPNIAADFALNENDLLGAFAGEQCLGVATVQEGYFFLYINSPAESSSQVTLRYYSAFYKNLFEAKDAFPFKNDDILGTIADPYIPALVVVK